MRRPTPPPPTPPHPTPPRADIVFPFFTYVPAGGWLGEELPQVGGAVAAARLGVLNGCAPVAPPCTTVLSGVGLGVGAAWARTTSTPTLYNPDPHLA